MFIDSGFGLFLLQFGRSKWNGNIGRTGIVVRVDTPIASVAQPSFSIQLNNAFEF